MFVNKVIINSNCIYKLLQISNNTTIITMKCICTDGDVIMLTTNYTNGALELFVTTDFTIEVVYERLKLTIPVQINKLDYKPFIVNSSTVTNYSLTAI